MTIVIGLFLVGMVASALFSGAETGFYRATRVRLLLDALSGNWTARGLLWLTNHPSLFVATTLLGNNLANYLVSLSIVVGTRRMWSSESYWATLIAPVALAPLVFVFGELTPKHVFYEAPNRLLRRCGPVLLLFTWLFLPISALLWALNQVLQRAFPAAPQQVRMALARQELAQLLEEGHQEGILRPTQRALAQGLFAVASRRVREFATPAARVTPAHLEMTKAQVQRLARQQRVSMLPVTDAPSSRELVGYVLVADLYLDGTEKLPTARPLVEIPDTETYIAALMRMHESPEVLGRIVNAQGRTVGFVSKRQLSEALFRGR